MKTRVGAEFERRGLEVDMPDSPIGGVHAILIDWKNGTLQGGSVLRTAARSATERVP